MFWARKSTAAHTSMVDFLIVSSNKPGIFYTRLYDGKVHDIMRILWLLFFFPSKVTASCFWSQPAQLLAGPIIVSRITATCSQESITPPSCPLCLLTQYQDFIFKWSSNTRHLQETPSTLVCIKYAHTPKILTWIRTQLAIVSSNIFLHISKLKFSF